MPDPTSPLASSKSPFLRHGAEQPVAWLPWGDAAFRRAAEEDRPILLDIGAVWCHWCHVMDRESYDDPDTAAVINELYVAVKVDRDERPDVDARYQRAVQSLVGQGGWPLTAFLTPTGEVFHGGTYFPPGDAHGRPAFRRVLREVARVWADERERVETVVSAVRERLEVVLTGEAAPGELDPALLDRAVDAFAQAYDARHGGFGGAPKFPSAAGMGLLLERWLDQGSERARDMVDGTLTAMVRGGIHDHLGGGFHRYATDARWIIPHFEKMAYDNGPLLEVLARAAVVLDRDDLADAAAGVVRYYRDVAGDLVDAGGFPASQDADIDFDDDGDYWTWTEAEIRDAVGDHVAAEAAGIRWGLRDPGSAMPLDPHRHVLFEAASVEDVARRLGRTADETRALLDDARTRLKAARDGRPTPYVDRTLYTGWVAMVASGHLAAARHLAVPGADEGAVRALERVWEQGWHGRGLVHRLGDPDSGVLLADQAHTARALLDAFEWTQDPRWLERAGALLDVVRDRFAHPSGGLRDLPSDHDAALAADRLEITDAPEPSPTAVAAGSMLRLAALRHDDDLAAAGRRILAAYAGSAPRFPTSAASFFRALRWAVGPVTRVVVVAGSEEGRDLTAAALREYRPATVVRRIAPDQARVELDDAVRAMLTGESPRAYVCVGSTCAAPVADPDELVETLRTFG
ncbi:MAG: thioredoxin domain-containing protein [Gemmatimonadota bacterium]